MANQPIETKPESKPAGAADHSPPQQPPAENPKTKRRRKHALITLGIVVLVIALIWFLYWLCWGQFHEYTDDAYVSGNLVRLMPQTSGTVTAIRTDDTQLVTQGQALIVIDPIDARIRLERAKANLAETVRQVRQWYEAVLQAKANAALRHADLVKAQDDYRRRQGMVGLRAISREELQHYLTNLEAARAQDDLALSKYIAALGLVENTTLYHHPVVETAKINLKNAYLDCIRTTIISPVTGYVAKRIVQVGQQVSPRTALMAIVPLNQIWVEANYKESQLGRLRIGQSVMLTADAYGSFQFHGKILGISAGTGSAFDLLPPQNATGNWIKVVQRVPVRIQLDPDELQKHPLRVGLSMRATTSTFNQDGNILNPTANDATVFSTTVFNDQLAHADKFIDAIVQANAPDMNLSSLLVKTGSANGA